MMIVLGKVLINFYKLYAFDMLIDSKKRWLKTFRYVLHN